MIHAVVFDFGNVLCAVNLRQFINRMAQHTHHSSEDLLALMPALSRSSIRYETGLISSAEYFTEISDIADLHIARDEFIEAYTTIFTPIPGMFPLIRRLKRSYKLGLLSNTNEWHFVHGIRPVEVFPLFDAVTLSYELQAMKPAPAIYDDMLRKLLLPAEECVFIDDLRENVEAARERGMHALLFTTAEALQRDLHLAGVDA